MWCIGWFSTKVREVLYYIVRRKVHILGTCPFHNASFWRSATLCKCLWIKEAALSCLWLWNFSFEIYKIWIWILRSKKYNLPNWIIRIRKVMYIFWGENYGPNNFIKLNLGRIGHKTWVILWPFHWAWQLHVLKGLVLLISNNMHTMFILIEWTNSQVLG